MIECSIFSPIFRALLIPRQSFIWLCRATVSHISHYNPMADNITVNLKMECSGKVWEGFGNKSWSGISRTIVNPFLLYFSENLQDIQLNYVHLSLGGLAVHYKSLLAYLSSFCSYQKQLYVRFAWLYIPLSKLMVFWNILKNKDLSLIYEIIAFVYYHLPANQLKARPEQKEWSFNHLLHFRHG